MQPSCHGWAGPNFLTQHETPRRGGVATGHIDTDTFGHLTVTRQSESPLPLTGGKTLTSGRLSLRPSRCASPEHKAHRKLLSGQCQRMQTRVWEWSALEGSAIVEWSAIVDGDPMDQGSRMTSRMNVMIKVNLCGLTIATLLWSQTALAAPLTRSCQAPALPAPTGNVITVASEPALQAAVAAVTSNATIVIQPGTYNLAAGGGTLYFNKSRSEEHTSELQ